MARCPRCCSVWRAVGRETIESDEMESRQDRLRSTGEILLGNRVPIAFSEDEITLHPETVLEFHPNGMALTAFGDRRNLLHRETCFSVGGGFVVTQNKAALPPQRPLIRRCLFVRG